MGDVVDSFNEFEKLPAGTHVVGKIYEQHFWASNGAGEFAVGIVGESEPHGAYISLPESSFVAEKPWKVIKTP